jgi:hypothetical protein
LFRLSTAVLAAAALVACNGGGEEDTTPSTDPTPGQTPAPQTPPEQQPGAGNRGRRAELPKMPPLTKESAKRVLLEQLGQLQDTEDVHAKLRYLALLGDKSAEKRIREQLLEKDADGLYPLDESGAAMGLHVLKLIGAEGLDQQVLDVAAEAIRNDMADSFTVAALSTLKGSGRQGEAEGLLVRMLESGDGISDVEAAAVLVEWGSEGARSAFVDVLESAKKEEGEYVDDLLIGAAVAGLVKLGDERGTKFMEEVLADPEGEFDPSAIVEGFAIKGATEVVPFLKRVVEQEISEDLGGDASYTASLALSVIYQDGGGGEHEAFLERILTELDEPYAAVTLWVIGKDDQAAAVAEEIKRTVLNVTNSDVSDAVFLLERIAERKAANDEAFRTLVDVAAQIEALGAKTPAAQKSATGRQRQLNAAAAYAYLKSR